MSAQPHITDIPSPETLQDRVGTHGQPEAKTKKRLVRRTDVDRSQLIRRGVQFAFVALNIYLGVQFYGWVRF